MSMRGRHSEVTERIPPTAGAETAADRPTVEGPTVEGPTVEGPTFDGAGTDLMNSPFDDDLRTQLTTIAPRRIANRFTLAIAAAALLTAGFLAGAQVQRHFGPATPSGSTSRGSFAGDAFASGQPFAGRAGAAGSGQDQGRGSSGGAATPTTGTVKLVDGTTVYLETPDGQVVTVKTTGSTAVRTAQGGALSDLAPGSSVTVEGSGSGDTITATTITRNG